MIIHNQLSIDLLGFALHLDQTDADEVHKRASLQAAIRYAQVIYTAGRKDEAKEIMDFVARAMGKDLDKNLADEFMKPQVSKHHIYKHQVDAMKPLIESEFKFWADADKEIKP